MKSILFEPVKVGKLTLKNRIFMSAAAAYTATADGDIDYSLPIFHFAVARGGCALVPTGGVGGTHSSGRMAANRPMFNTDERIPSFKRFADQVHAGGAAAVIQLTHSGGGAAAYQLGLGRKPFVASYYFKNPKGGFGVENREDCPTAEEEIRDVIAAYGDAAARARRAGFDGVQVHAAHESLLAQWFSPLYNTRADTWGGSVANRCRIHREILADIKRKAGRDFPTIMKLGIEDVYPGGATAAEGIQAAELIAREGNVDIIEVSQGLQDISDMNKTSMKPMITSLAKEAYYRERTRKVKTAVKDCARVTMQGGLRTPALMEEVVENGEADFVSMCRPYIREPDLVKRWLGGDTARARCISCNKCLQEHILHNQPLQCILEKLSNDFGSRNTGKETIRS
jgi:2,4-dienoyl-CoA reductase-like NADH-dependent reductase (Old Yellow Enzyme family)